MLSQFYPISQFMISGFLGYHRDTGSPLPQISESPIPGTLISQYQNSDIDSDIGGVVISQLINCDSVISEQHTSDIGVNIGFDIGDSGFLVSQLVVYDIVVPDII